MTTPIAIDEVQQKYADLLAGSTTAAYRFQLRRPPSQLAPIDAAIAGYEQAKATALALRTGDPAYAAAVAELDAAHAVLARILKARHATYLSASGSMYGYSRHEDSLVVVPRVKGKKGQAATRPAFPTPDPQEATRQVYVRQAAVDRAAVIPERFADQEG